ISSGFDVVIGNPPYIQIQNFSGKQEQKAWENQHYVTYAKTGDVYCLFYERGFHLLAPNGVLTYITSNKWMRANYGKAMRKFFLREGRIAGLIDFGDSQIFENATTYTNILVWIRSQENHDVPVWDLSQTYESDVSLKEMLEKEGRRDPLFNEDSFVIAKGDHSRIKQRIEKIGVPLKHWDVSIYRGILTGFNEAFIIDGKKKDELIAQDPNSAEILKPILRGRDIKRYEAEFADLWIINSHNGYDKVPAIKIDDYPVIKRHLEAVEASRIRGELGEKAQKAKGLFNRDDQGKTPYNLRNCAYINEFEKEKIVYAEIVYDSAFYYDTMGFYPEATSFLMTGECLKFLIALLNSKLLTYAFKSFYAGGDLRGNTFRYKKVFLENLPIPKLNPASQHPFEVLVDHVLFSRGKDMDSEASMLERVIDSMVYELYFPEEIKSAGCEVLKHLTNLPELKEDWNDEEKMKTIEKVYRELSDPTHPVSLAMKKMKEIKEIKIIEGRS
ncbi:Eco57I restriction-modification methylase domain-containing protein, partial [Deltaproteobacteria bacterium TL4]